ncbi:MAG: hypothetical protein H8D22_10500, partial [Candidatus Cloacimonetes bacterium]|nr:hypothetical protein [Candidatus Cloacimonadota bacterium]
MKNIPPEVYVYFDHNILDSLVKGDLFNIKGLLKKIKCIALFSDENIKEIVKSKGYENKFLEVLKEIEAQYLTPIVNESFLPTGNAKVKKVDPFEAYNTYLNNVDSLPRFGYGLSGMLLKYYGGLEDKTFEEIAQNGAQELKDFLNKSLENIEDIDEIDPKLKNALKDFFAEAPEIIKESGRNLANQLDGKSEEAQVTQFEKATGIGPRTLNNIKGPNALLKVWDSVKKGLPDHELDLEIFFGIKPAPWSPNPERELTILEKVNAIYHQLNFLGYFRDPHMKVERRFNSSFSDMTHAGLATFCHLFICSDKNLTMKASAAYEY